MKRAEPLSSEASLQEQLRGQTAVWIHSRSCPSGHWGPFPRLLPEKFLRLYRQGANNSHLPIPAQSCTALPWGGLWDKGQGTWISFQADSSWQAPILLNQRNAALGAGGGILAAVKCHPCGWEFPFCPDNHHDIRNAGCAGAAARVNGHQMVQPQLFPLSPAYLPGLNLYHCHCQPESVSRLISFTP